MNDKTAPPKLDVAKKKDLDQVLQLIREYHEMAGLEVRSSKLMTAVYPLLKKQSEHGCILLISVDSKTVGYLVLSFSYSIEFGGRFGFIDEYFLKKDFRGKKISKTVLAICKELAAELGLQALQLKVRTDAEKLQGMYQESGLTLNKNDLLMSTTISK